MKPSFVSFHRHIQFVFFVNCVDILTLKIKISARKQNKRKQKTDTHKTNRRSTTPPTIAKCEPRVVHFDLRNKVLQSILKLCIFFFNSARLSSHQFPSIKEEKAALMYNYNPVYTGNLITMLQCYFWK